MDDDMHTTDDDNDNGNGNMVSVGLWYIQWYHGVVTNLSGYLRSIYYHHSSSFG
jgi:hypothetical protein